jgi:hypothetical protein
MIARQYHADRSLLSKVGKTFSSSSSLYRDDESYADVGARRRGDGGAALRLKAEIFFEQKSGAEDEA